MDRWAPRPALGVLLLLAYPVLTHAAITTGLAYLAWAAWLCIAALVVLSFPGQWGLAGFALLAAAPLAADPDALVKLPPVIINLALAVWFGRTLAPGEEPMISWFARLVRGTEVPADIARYTRCLTVVWTAFFLIMAAAAALLAELAPPQIWSVCCSSASTSSGACATAITSTAPSSTWFERWPERAGSRRGGPPANERS